MYLLTLLILFILLGYLLAGSRFGERLDSATGRTTASSKRWLSRLGERWRGLFKRSEPADTFRLWALGAGAGLFPQDFKTWLSGLLRLKPGSFTSPWMNMPIASVSTWRS